MAAYPTTQAEIFGLVKSMIAGYSKHPDDFPSADIASLQNARDQYQTASAALANAQAAAKQAANKKAEKLKQLQTVTKSQLKRSQVDTMDNPQKLCFIGWGPRAEPQSTQTPRPPVNLKIISQGIIGGEYKKGLLELSWDKSDYLKARFVRYYCIQRRQMSAKDGDEQGRWQQIASAINNEIFLKDQPIGQRLEYRVKAVNKGGESEASNTITVTL